MKSNLRFLLALGSAKLVMLNNAGQNMYYSKIDNHLYKSDFSKIVSLLQNR